MITVAPLGGFTSGHSRSAPRLDSFSTLFALGHCLPAYGDGDSMETGKDVHSLVSIQLSEFGD